MCCGWVTPPTESCSACSVLYARVVFVERGFALVYFLGSRFRSSISLQENWICLHLLWFRCPLPPESYSVCFLFTCTCRFRQTWPRFGVFVGVIQIKSVFCWTFSINVLVIIMWWRSHSITNFMLAIKLRLIEIEHQLTRTEPQPVTTNNQLIAIKINKQSWQLVSNVNFNYDMTTKD